MPHIVRISDYVYPANRHLVRTDGGVFGNGGGTLGAGGGGCMVLSVPEGKRREIENKLRERRVQVIDYSIAPKGVSFEANAAEMK